MKPYDKTPREALRIARRNGRSTGAGRADVQYLPGGGRDTAPRAAERAATMLRQWDDGDPACPIVCPDWLSGEWADDPTPATVAADCGVNEERDVDGMVAQECADAFVAAADDAFLATILRHLRHVAKGN
jgi:hypothetical protein